MGRVRNNKVWLYFDRLSDFAARCKRCKLNLSCKHTSANLVRHLFYKHHVDASYYGAERTGFLKYKRRRNNQRSTTDEEEAPPFTPQMVTSSENLFDPLLEVKQEFVSTKFGTFNCGDHLNQGGTNSVQDCQIPAASIPPISTSDLNNINDGDIMNGSNCSVNIQTDAVSAEICVEPFYEKEKLKAETRYYNEMAELARAKRIMIELQSEKLKLEMETMRSS